ncbi:hypothetical protein [Streptomyces phaeochromogenes]|uniref:hypothetical protein n=1 Tax=Streptomyces phaeochromogenes TaxID=1923 RepID=UPI0038673773|nr:hypothetical protein OHB08_03715 [Streptomyces phaeochromogenes]
MSLRPVPARCIPEATVRVGTAERKFADAETLTPAMREVFGTDRRIAAVDRGFNGTNKGVYRVTLDDATSTIVYVWNPV